MRWLWWCPHTLCYPASLQSWVWARSMHTSCCKAHHCALVNTAWSSSAQIADSFARTCSVSTVCTNIPAFPGTWCFNHRRQTLLMFSHHHSSACKYQTSKSLPCIMLQCLTLKTAILSSWPEFNFSFKKNGSMNFDLGMGPNFQQFLNYLQIVLLTCLSIDDYKIKYQPTLWNVDGASCLAMANFTVLI